MFTLFLTDTARAQLAALQKNKSQVKRHKAVLKTLAYLQSNPRHPGLCTHKFTSVQGPKGEPVFEPYAENKTPAAFRVFWYYGPNKSDITVLVITQHP